MQSPHTVVAAIRALRRQLPTRTAIWVGGQCPVLYQRRLPGVLPLQAISALPAEVARWRSQAAQACASVDL